MSTGEQRKISLTSRALWLMSAKTLAFAFTLAIPLFLARQLSRAEFGLYKQVFLVLNSAVQILPMGFHMSAFYFLARRPREKGAVVYNIVLFNVVTGTLGCLVFLIFPDFPGRLFHSQEAAAFSPYLGVMILLWVISSFLDLAAVANEETHASTVLIVGAQLSKTVLLLTAAAFFSTVQALVWAAILQGVLQSAALLVYLRSRFPAFWRQFQWPMLREQLSYALPFGVAALLSAFQLDLHNYIVANRFSADVFAIYSIGCLQLPFLGILAESVTSVMIPRASALQKEGKPEEILRLAANAIRKLACVFFPAYCLLLAVGPVLLTFLFSERYQQSWPIFAINLTMVPLNAFVFDPLLRAYAEERHYLFVLFAALLVMQAVFLVPAVNAFGPRGAVTVAVLSALVGRTAMGWRIARRLHVGWRDLRMFSDLGKIALASTTAGGAAWLLRYSMGLSRPFWILAWCGLSFVAVYLGAAILLRIPTADDYNLVRRQWQSLRKLTPVLASRSEKS